MQTLITIITTKKEVIKQLVNHNDLLSFTDYVNNLSMLPFVSEVLICTEEEEESEQKTEEEIVAVSSLDVEEDTLQVNPDIF